MRKVLVALRMAGEAGQGKMSGIYRFLSEGHPWNVKIVESTHELTPSAVADAVRDGTEGFIISLLDPEKNLAALAESDIPTVVMDIHNHPLCERKNNIAFIRNDAKAIAEAAFRHLYDQGRFRSYAYIPAKEDERWSYARGTAFTNCAASHGIVCHTYSGDIELTAFLKSLEPPTALFAATDIRANEILQAARIGRIAVPRRLAVIGVDDNRLICENAQPQLSSIRPDFDEEGYLAARELDRLMNHASRRAAPIHTPAIIRVGIKGIALRDSTAEETTAGKLVSRAADYIRNHATKGITVDDVVRHMKVSRRLLYLRFSEQRGETILEAIQKRQLEEVAKLLQTTKLSTEKIAALCGFANANVLRNLFKRTFSASMRDCRKAEAATTGAVLNSLRSKLRL
ncbi:MAG: substrate-binding domain-containing protein [bacterium]|nr:substrate-binding domain-containing protein [Candidatus Colisoma equi]